MSEFRTDGLARPGRARDARRAALYCGVYVGAVLAWQVRGNHPDLATAAFAFLFWGMIGAAGGAVAVYAGAAWRTETGRWHVAPAFVALAAGTPVALLGRMMPGEPRMRNGLLAAAAWVLAVAVVSALMRLRRASAGKGA